MYSEINNMESKTMIIFCFMKNFLFYLPAPSNINYFWNLGSLIGVMLMIQIISGFFLSLHYLSSMNEAFYSVIHLNREVYMGWLIRFFHINGASAFFFLIFSHVMKNIMNSSWKFTNLWMSGVTILLIAMATAFVGYVLPWGQMSFWAATVITNLLSAIPYVGSAIVEWIWGGFSVNYPTLTRFYSFHFIMPMVIFGFVIIHIILLHSNGSSNPISSPLNSDKIYFHPYYSVKDILGFLFMLYIFMFILTISPYYSVDAENFIEANSLVTPIHIKPEWYFLFAYAILRSIPNKVGGVLCLILSILLLYIKPFQNSFSKMKFNLLSKIFKMNYFFSFIMLTYLGSQTIDYPYEALSMVFSFLYFMFMLLM